MNEAQRKRNAKYQRAYRARMQSEEPGKGGFRLNVVISANTKQRLKELAEAGCETEKFTLEWIIKKAHDQMARRKRMKLGDEVEYQYGGDQYGNGKISALNNETEIAEVVDEIDGTTWRGPYDYITVICE